MIENLKHWSIVGKQMSNMDNRNVSELKNGENAHLLGLEAWCCPEAGRTFRARREETEALRRGQGREWGAWIYIRWLSQGGTRLDLAVCPEA